MTDVRTALMAQIACADAIESDFITLTKGEGKRILKLLEEQEAVEPITEHKLFLCPVCKNTLFREQNFCHECGKRIEWEVGETE